MTIWYDKIIRQKLEPINKFVIWLTNKGHSYIEEQLALNPNYSSQEDPHFNPKDLHRWQLKIYNNGDWEDILKTRCSADEIYIHEDNDVLSGIICPVDQASEGLTGIADAYDVKIKFDEVNQSIADLIEEVDETLKEFKATFEDKVGSMFEDEMFERDFIYNRILLEQLIETNGVVYLEPSTIEIKIGTKCEIHTIWKYDNSTFIINDTTDFIQGDVDKTQGVYITKGPDEKLDDEVYIKTWKLHQPHKKYDIIVTDELVYKDKTLDKIIEPINKDLDYLKQEVGTNAQDIENLSDSLDNFKGEFNNFKEELEEHQYLEKVAELPQEGEDEGSVFQYIGDTTELYIHNHIYKCVPYNGWKYKIISDDILSKDNIELILSVINRNTPLSGYENIDFIFDLQTKHEVCFWHSDTNLVNIVQNAPELAALNFTITSESNISESGFYWRDVYNEFKSEDIINVPIIIKTNDGGLNKVEVTNQTITLQHISRMGEYSISISDQGIYFDNNFDTKLFLNKDRLEKLNALIDTL